MTSAAPSGGMSGRRSHAFLPLDRMTLPGWLPPFAAASLAWNLMAALGALANFGDAQRASVHASFLATLLRFMLQQSPLTVLSLALAIGLYRVQLTRPSVGRLTRVYLAALLVFVPLLCTWQSVVDRLYDGRPLVSLPGLLMQQNLLTWWFDAVMLTVAFGAHLAYSTWRHGHAETLARQQAQQVNLTLRLRLLQSQLEPYFLSSALAGIGKLISTEQRGPATRALARLSELLRYALRASQSDWQSVADEIQFMRDYVDMQSLCLGGAVPVQWQLDASDWAGFRCPPLLLFPMVEQALYRCPPDGAAATGVSVCFAMLRKPEAARIQVVVRYPHGGGRVGTLDDLRERLAMLYHGAATLGIRVDGGAVELRLEYPAEDHDA
jgi:two-component system sensor histidine kinase AlgZ